jgi:hypothetical protein
MIQFNTTDTDGEYPEFNYEKIIKETEKAVLIDLDNKRQIWLPKSQVEFDDNEKIFNIPRNLAENKELI